MSSTVADSSKLPCHWYEYSPTKNEVCFAIECLAFSVREFHAVCKLTSKFVQSQDALGAVEDRQSALLSRGFSGEAKGIDFHAPGSFQEDLLEFLSV